MFNSPLDSLSHEMLVQINSPFITGLSFSYCFVAILYILGMQLFYLHIETIFFHSMSCLFTVYWCLCVSHAFIVLLFRNHLWINYLFSINVKISEGKETQTWTHTDHWWRMSYEQEYSVSGTLTSDTKIIRWIPLLEMIL